MASDSDRTARLNYATAVMATRTTGSGGNAGSYILTQYGYDGYGRQDVVTDNAGHETVTSYDADGRVVRTVANYVNGVDAADTDTDQTTGYVYDVLGRLATQIAYNPDGQAVQTQETRYVYASDGNRTVPVAVVYGDSGDTLSRDTATGFWSITSGSDHVSTTYDVLGRKLTSTDQRGRC